MQKINKTNTNYTIGSIHGINIQLDYSPITALKIQRENPHQHVCHGNTIGEIKIFPIANDLKMDISFITLNGQQYQTNIAPAELEKMKALDPTTEIKIHLIGDTQLRNKKVLLHEVEINPTLETNPHKSTVNLLLGQKKNNTNAVMS